ncbi:MAG: hypothetical protein U1E94_00195 [Agitococcus sp.]
MLEPRFRYSEADKAHILSFINEGMSLRGISRKFPCVATDLNSMG